MIYPVDPPHYITQRFGENPKDYERFNLKGHNGLDLAVPIGTAVKAAADGIVEKVAKDAKGYGEYVRVRHGRPLSQPLPILDTKNGERSEVFVTLYAHLERALVVMGDNVSQGQVIGKSGSSGNSTGPHLHFEVRLPGEEKNGYGGAVDPEIFFLALSGPTPDSPTPGPLPISKSRNGEGGMEKPTRLMRVIDGVRVRAEPNIRNSSNILCELPAGLTVGVFYESRVGIDIWANLGNHLWCALKVAGKTYLENVRDM